jgi:hypothetical protein
MMHTRTAMMAVALAALALAGGCTSEKNTTADPAPTATGPLRSAPDVEASRAATAARDVQFGQLGTLPGGTTVTVAGPVVGHDEEGAWLTVQVRVENRSSRDGTMPIIGIRCAGQARRGTPLIDIPTTASSLDTFAALPAGSYRAGQLKLLLPGDSRTQEPVPTCTGPAFVEALDRISQVVDGAPVTVRVPLTPAQLAALNAGRGR